MKNRTCFFISVLVIPLLFTMGNVVAQTQSYKGTKLIDFYLADQQIKQADSMLAMQLDILWADEKIDSLIDYLYYVGKIALELHGVDSASSRVVTFAEKIKQNTESPSRLRQLQLELSAFYELIGNSQKAYDCNIKALEYTSQMGKASAEEYGIIQSNLGTLAKRIGQVSLALRHHRLALKYLESDPGSSGKRLYITYNALGGMMWFASKIDSALYFYQKAEETLMKLEQNPMNKYYRPAMLLNNISAIYSSQGNPERAMKAMKESITKLNAFMDSDAPDVKKEAAQSLYFSAIENYAGIFKDLGNLQQAKDLLQYSYDKKQKKYNKDSPELFRSKILLGQIYLALKDYELADKFLEEGISQIKRIPGGHYFWNADAYYYKATIHDELGNVDSATVYYEKAQALYEYALQGAYDEIYLEFIIQASYFYARNGEDEKALKMANKTYDYIVENQGEKSLFEFYQILNLGEIYYVLGNYEMALSKSKASLDLLNDPLFRRNNSMDSLYINFQKPQAILLKAKSEYQLNTTKDSIVLKNLLSSILDAISTIEQRKQFLDNDNSLSILISDNISTFEFAKTLALKLYNKTNSFEYLNLIFRIHESSVYNRIRSRLSSKAKVSFKNLPKQLLSQETYLKEKLGNALHDQGDIELFFKADDEWKSFLNRLKKDYPNYYRLKYASISESFNTIEDFIPPGATVVRYIFINDSLHALVMNENSMDLFKLNSKNLSSLISKTHNVSLGNEEISNVLFQLYQSLWKPFKKMINTDHVVIIPDRELFNLSFEMLTPKPIKSFNDFAENSLLSNHFISYNYSLLLINQAKEALEFDDNFVAFVPEFTDKMKEDYKMAISDSLRIDKTYLTLLPQPFSVKLAKEAASLFGGKSFINEKSTRQIFMNQAKEHKIIHIGTHAESNNIRPELSRIIFAKNIEKNTPEDENSFYTYEIYDCNLASNLTILTACETGKPSWQPGEGMISLAHAFNYAGSQSILTSLWKIDEKSSVELVELFYGYLSKGFEKDKALQKAKLDYLASEEGRTLSPNYWAGLILIGDISPIQIARAQNFYYWLFGLLIIAGFIFMLLRRKP